MLNPPLCVLPILRLEVAHAEGVSMFNPNSLIAAFLREDGAPATWRPIGGPFLRDAAPLASVISGQPAVIYRSLGWQIPLTIQELRRLVLRALQPEEFQTLYRIYGPIHEIHEDYYDTVTGEALQPAI